MNDMKSKRTPINISEFYRKYGIIIIFIAMFVISAMINKNFLKPQNLLNILKQISVVTIIACAETMLIVSGMIDLSAGLVCTMTMCFSAGVLVATGSLAVAILAGVGSGVLAGWINGFMITKFKLQPFIATLAMTNVAEGISQVYTGGLAINGVEKARFLGQGAIASIPVPVIVMFVVVAVIFILMKYTKLGLYIYAIGGNEQATIASGVNVNRQKRIIFSISGGLVGLAGVILMARLMSAQPSVGTGYEFDAITGTIVGGTSFTGGVGSVFCALIGSIIVGLINNILNLLNVSSQYQMIIKGVLIAGAVILDTKTKESSMTSAAKNNSSNHNNKKEEEKDEEK